MIFPFTAFFFPFGCDRIQNTRSAHIVNGIRYKYLFYWQTKVNTVAVRLHAAARRVDLCFLCRQGMDGDKNYDARASALITFTLEVLKTHKKLGVNYASEPTMEVLRT